MAGAASDKKGRDIVIIKMRKISGICDYFVISGGTSTTQVRAIADNIVKMLKEKGERLKHIEGEREASWILVDFGDVVGHVFLEKTRKFYDLERLWSKAPQEKFEETVPNKRPAKHSRSVKRKASSAGKKSVKPPKRRKHNKSGKTSIRRGSKRK